MENPEGEEGENGGANVFARSGKLQRSPVQDDMAATASSSTAVISKSDVVMSQVVTPISSSATPQGGLHLERSSMMLARKKINELYDFVNSKSNLHKEIKTMVTSIRTSMGLADREYQAWRTRVGKAEKALKETMARLAEAEQTQKDPPNPRADKRDRDTPGDEEEAKKRKDDEEGNKMGEIDGGDGDWRRVENLKEKRKKQKEEEARKKEEKKKEEKTKEEAKKKEKERWDDRKKQKPKPRRERSRGDALIVEAKDKASYAELLRKVREDPALQQLGENVVKTRRTQKGEILFELKKDPSVKSSAFRNLVENSLGEGASVRALSQETVVECRDLDEITTADELKSALEAQCALGDVPMTIRMRKAYGGTQVANIRLATAAANKLLGTSKVKVGWSVCPLKVIPPVTKQMERCFRCMGFGHRARNCRGPDRSELCRRCGEKGHVAKDCTKQPKCVLCEEENGNDHMTGSFRCPAFKKAMAGQQ